LPHFRVHRQDPAEIGRGAAAMRGEDRGWEAMLKE